MGLKAGPTGMGAAGGGQTNTISSDGGGLGITSTIPKVGVDLRVRSLAATLPLSVAQVANLITLTIAALVNADIAAGAGIALSKLERIHGFMGTSQNNSSGNTVLFVSINGSGAAIGSATEANVDQVIDFAFTVRRLTVWVETNSKDQDVPMIGRDDGGDITNMTVTALAGVTGSLTTGAISDAVASGSLCAFEIDRSACTSGSMELGSISTEYSLD